MSLIDDPLHRDACLVTLSDAHVGDCGRQRLQAEFESVSSPDRLSGWAQGWYYGGRSIHLMQLEDWAQRCDGREDTAEPAASPSPAIDQRWLEELCRRTDVRLWRAYDGVPRDRLWSPTNGFGRQEVLSALVAELAADESGEAWWAASGVATRASYTPVEGWGTAAPRRGSFDLALYRGEGKRPRVAVELQVEGLLLRYSRWEERFMDGVVKLLVEEPHALWLHVVRDARRSDLPMLARMLDTALLRLSKPFSRGHYAEPVDTSPRQIAFHLCALNPDEHRMSIHRVLEYRPSRPRDRLFPPSLRCWDEWQEAFAAHAWHLHRDEPAAVDEP